MNKEAIDQLFKQKLSGHQIAPPATAWEKLDSQLHTRRKPIWWWLRAAAVLLLIFVGTWMISSLLKEQSDGVNEIAHQNQTSQEQGLTVSKEEKTKNQIAEAKPLPTAESNQASNNGTTDKVEAKSINQDPSPSVSITKVKIPKTNKPARTKISKSVPIKEVADPPITTALAQSDEAPPSMVDDENIAAEQKPEPNVKKAAIRIIYKRSAAQPEPVLAHNNSQDQQPSRIKRAWRKAKNLKANDLSIGKLRAVKDDLLAFKSEKNNTASKSN